MTAYYPKIHVLYLSKCLHVVVQVHPMFIVQVHMFEYYDKLGSRGCAAGLINTCFDYISDKAMDGVIIEKGEDDAGRLS